MLTRTVSIIVRRTSASFRLKSLTNTKKATNIVFLENDNTVANVNFLGVVSSGTNIGRAKTRPTRPFAKALVQGEPGTEAEGLVAGVRVAVNAAWTVAWI